MRCEWTLFFLFVFLVFVSKAFAAETSDPCLNPLTIDHPNLCLNASNLLGPEVCKDHHKPVAPPSIDLTSVLAPPPDPSSAAQKDDLETVLSVQADRTTIQASCAKADACQSIFRFAGVMGPRFAPENLPLTTALMNKVFADANADVAYAKMSFKRPRPFITDKKVKKIVNQCPDFSYPSGHSTYVYVIAILLSNMVPERKAAIYARAHQYAYNRVVAGVHYPSDVEAGRISASIIDYVLLHDPHFQEQYAPAREELRTALGLR
jgi:acid phosphatase (class A)